ncbi:MAG: hypothetical protein IJX03_02395, partial [Clostridia bacterium]|nr:hypothetical protein [Clostridia bacterium]
KVLVLKEVSGGYSNGKPVSGIARVEVENGVAELFLTVINLTAAISAEYKVMLVDGRKNTHFISAGKNPSSLREILPERLDFQKGFAVGIYSVKDDIPLTIAFAREDGFDFFAGDFKRAVAEKCLCDRRTNKKREDESEKNPDAPTVENPIDPAPIRPPYPPAPEPDPTVTPPEEFPSPKSEEIKAVYDDEAVATENYYELDDGIQVKLSAVKEWTYGNVRLEDATADFGRAKETNKSVKDADGFPHETNFDNGEDYSAEQPYHLTVREELNGIFNKFPNEVGLENIFHDSRFARINYSDDKFYVVGLIKESGKEKYICYGVPGVYAPEPPKELRGYCSFIPLSIFDLSGDGYWMMFQDAVTGNCIKPQNER